jgi:hypothetical protein
MARRDPNLREKLAAALYHSHDATGRRLLPEAVLATNDIAAIIGAVEWDHLHNLVGLQAEGEATDNSPANLMPRLKAQHGGTDHARKTHGVKHGFAGSDRHRIARSKRLTERRLAAEDPTGTEARKLARKVARKAKIKGRPLSGTKASGWRRRMNGKAERR